MAQLGQAFNPNDVEPAADYSPIPAGEYNVMIIDSDMKPTKSQNGYYLELSMQVLEGEHANRIVWDRLNLQNPNQKAVEIAQRTLSSICHACGVTGVVQDSQQLHNIPMIAKVVYVPEKDGYGAKNEVKAYKASQQSQQAPSTQPAPQQQPAAQQPQPAGGSQPPWTA